MPDGVVETDRRDGVLRVARSGTRWLSTGGTDGPRTADAAYNLTVPEGFDRTDLAGYAAEFSVSRVSPLQPGTAGRDRGMRF